MSVHAWLAMSVALAGTAPEADPSEAYIVNGEEIGKNKFPSAVAIGFDVPNFGRQATCSASFITPRILLTAAHCTAEFERQGISPDILNNVAVAFLGAEVNEPGIETIGFQDFINHPRYSGSQTRISNDIGVVVLEERTRIQPVWIQTEPVADAKVVGSEVTSVGFGITSSSSQGSSGIKRKAELVVSDVDEQFLYVNAADNATRSNVCSGDSGGPQYFERKNGRLLQWGVHSFVFSLSGGDPCLSASGSTRVETFTGWILDRIGEVHDTTDGCAINDLYGDRLCDTFCDEPDPDCEADDDGDGVVSEQELEVADGDGDGVVEEGEALEGGSSGCSQTGGAPDALVLAGLAALAGRRRRR